MTAYRRGVRLERKTIAHLMSRGYELVIRAAGSRGPWDLVAFGADHVLVVQTKARAPSPRELRAYRDAKPRASRAEIYVWPRYARMPHIIALSALLSMLVCRAVYAAGDVEWIYGGPTGTVPAGTTTGIVALDDERIVMTTQRGVVREVDVRSGQRVLHTAPDARALTGPHIDAGRVCWLDTRDRARVCMDGERLTRVPITDCLDPWDIAWRDGDAVVACLNGHAIMREIAPGQWIPIMRYSRDMCAPSESGVYGPRSIATSGSALYIASAACGAVYERDILGQVRLAAGRQWGIQPGSITPGETLATSVALGAYAVRIDRGVMYVGMRAGVVRIVDGRITHHWRAPADITDGTDGWGMYVALSPRYVYAAGRGALVRIVRPEAPEPTPTPAATATAAPSPTVSERDACSIARELARILCSD